MIFNTVGDRQLEGLAWERIVGTSVTPERTAPGRPLGAEANSYLDAGDAVKALKAPEKMGPMSPLWQMAMDQYL